MTSLLRGAVIVALAVPFAVTSGCGGDATENKGSALDIPIGDRCIPAEEIRTNFPGYELTEVSIESGGETCSPGVCLIAHFQGRVSCPYGQPDTGMVDPTTGFVGLDPSLAPDQYCYAAGTRQDPPNRVVVPVRPQYVGRSPDKAVYCSCRCDGPNPQGSYCSCPTGFVCEPLVMSGGDPYEGSYCIKKGTELEDPTALQNTPLCNATNPIPRPIGCGVDRHPGGL